MMGENKEAFDQARHMLSQGQDLEAVMSFLRTSGCSKISSIKIMRQVAGISLGQAKELVHFSKAWQDVKQRDEDFHAALEAAVEELLSREDG